MLSPLLAALTVLALTQPQPTTLANLREVPFTQVQIKDAFWSPRQETNRTVSLKHNLDKLEQAGNVANLELAAQGKREGYHGPVFMDSDLFKGVEAVSYSLATHPDPELSARLDAIIAKIAAAQMPDGYLNTHYQVNAPDKRFTNLRDNHELYCAGHLFEAAVAHHQATGSRTLLDVATKYADLLCETFGPEKRPGYCGHPEIELALVKLSRVVDQPRSGRYFALARHFVDTRGTHFFAREHNTPEVKYNGEYWQDNVPIREHQRIVGHAVRAAYLLSACTDIGAATNDESLLRMVRRIWRNTTERNTYITGGIGPSAHNEGFTVDYDLPNESAYQETCASVAMILWNHRLNLAYADAKYADFVETALYNGALAGVSLDGTKFFYVNPLASRGGHHRRDWYGCACCPPNICRLLASIGSYIYATGADGKSLWVNQYIQGSVTPEAIKGLKVSVTTRFPWDGAIKFTIDSVGADPRFALKLRVPKWNAGMTPFLYNGQDDDTATMDNGYVTVTHDWKAGDTFSFSFAMPVRRVEASPNVEANRGLQALARGPLIYCIEGADINYFPVAIAPDTVLRPTDRPDLLGGIVAITGKCMTRVAEPPERELYFSAPNIMEGPLTAIPYYAWDNRQAGPMQVWHPNSLPTPKVPTIEARAKVSISYKNWNCDPEAARDGVVPARSNDTPAANCHWWNHKGGTEWIEYRWPQGPIDAARVQVFWFDDTGRGECRLPKSARLLAQVDGDWKPVGEVPVAKDRWCDLKFAAIHVDALKLEVQQQDAWSAGILEWRVTAPESDD